MSNTTPSLPPIKKKHCLNIEKASNRVLQNYIACHDSGNTSVLYKLTPKNYKDNIDELPVCYCFLIIFFNVIFSEEFSF